MSVKALIIGDPHFKVSNRRETDIMVKDILDEAKKHQPHFIVVLGDVLDRHEIIHVNPLTRAISFLQALTRYAPTYVLIGNHDLKNNQEFLSEEHPFTALKSWKDITIVDRPISRIIQDQSFVFVPYVPPGQFLQALEHLPLSDVTHWTKARCIFAHQEFRGCHMGAIISSEGDVWNPEWPLVISGHIHDYQQLQRNLLYPGTPIQHTYSDRQDKGITLCHFPPNTDDYQSTRLTLTVPLKHIVRLSYTQLTHPPTIRGEAKIIISGTSNEIKGLQSHPTIDAWKRDGHKIVFKTLASANVSTASLAQVRPYREELLSALQEQPTLLSLYREIFPHQ